MGKENRGVRDSTGPYSGSGRSVGQRRRAGAICPFDEESKEDIRKMKLDIDSKDMPKIVSDKVGKGRITK